MKATFTAHRQLMTELEARGVMERADMPAYVRIQIENFPFSSSVLVDPDAARRYALELLSAADAADGRETAVMRSLLVV